MICTGVYHRMKKVKIYPSVQYVGRFEKKRWLSLEQSVYTLWIDSGLVCW